MKHFSTLFAVLVLSFFTSNSLFAQSTFGKIYQTLQTNCQGSGCHGATNFNSFSVAGSSSDVYDAIYDVAPENIYAKDSLDNKLVYPGQPARSFLLRKISNCFDGDLILNSEEEDAIEGTHPVIDDITLELIRQWINYGAPENGTIPNEDLIEEYYNNTEDHVQRMTPLAPPRECEGFQVHLGPIYLAPGEEVEYFLPYKLELDDDLEVTNLEVKMNQESHHFIIYSLDQNEFDNTQKGLRPLELSSFGNGYINAWQDDDSYELPNGTAFFWEKNRALDLNYHIFNYNQDKILPTEVYLNIYTQPKGTAEKEMKSKLIPVSNIQSFTIPRYDSNDPEKTITYTEEVVWNNPDTISLFMLSTHTHSWGIGYDIFRRDPNAADKKGDMLYDGRYNFDYTFNTGNYDWEHPAVRRFEPFLPVDMNLGLVHEATYKTINSDGVEPVGCIPNLCGLPSNLLAWSFQTNGEMMLIYMQYIEGTYEIPTTPLAPAQCDVNEPYPSADPCGKYSSISNNNILPEGTVNVFPNPFTGTANIVVDLPANGKLNIEVFDMMGKRVSVIADDSYNIGKHAFAFNSEGTSNGVYFVRVTMNNKSLTKKLIEVK